jgi:hypothetical protein
MPVMSGPKPAARAGAVVLLLLTAACPGFLGAAAQPSAQPEAGHIGGLSVEVEAGPVWQGRNDVEIPNDGTATRIAVEELIGRGPSFSWRVYLSYDFNERHGLRLLVAPLTIEGDGTPTTEIRFDDETFEPGVLTHAKYRFSSYRLTYRYLFFNGERFRWHVGFTGKIRDAEVALSQGSNEASYDNVGFVPLLHLAGEWKMSERWSAILDADALAAPQGRAEDVALKIGYKIADAWSATAGYRMVEGGADNDEVYTFAWLHYVVASVRYDF